MAKLNFSGRKSAVVIGLVAKNKEVSAYPTLTEVSGIVYTITASAAISAATNQPALAKDESAFLRNGVWHKIDGTSVFLTVPAGAIAGSDGYKIGEIAFLVPSANSIDLTNGTEIESWESFGTIYRDKMPTIMDWNGSIAAKVDFGDNPAQIYIYKSLLQQQEVTLYSYLYFVSSSGAIDTTKAVRQYGKAYLTSFNISASPTTVADVTIDYEGDGELKMEIGSEVIETNWSALN